MTKLTSLFALGFYLLGASLPVQAAPLFATASGDPLTSGLVVDDYFWPTHRFEIGSPTVVASVGGYFDNTTAGAISIFGAIVALPGATDFPDSLDLSSADVLATTVIEVLPPAGLYSGALPISLMPGWYALAFGTGRFGADSVVGTDVIMPSLAIDLDPQLPFTAIQAGNPYGTPPQFIAQLASPRFHAAPEPSTLALIPIGFACLLWASGRAAAADPA